MRDRFSMAAVAALSLSVSSSIGAAVQTPAPGPRAQPPAAAPAAEAADVYRLGVNDEIQITVFGPQNLDVKTRVKEDGTVAFPFLGTVKVAGETARTLSARLERDLRAGGYYVAPVVNVEVVGFVSNTVTVAGNVTTPGVFPLDRPLSLTMIVARAGGARGDGADFAIVRRVGQAAEQRVRFDDLSDPTGGANMALRAGDTVFIPPAPHIFIYGEVKSPGEFTIRGKLTVRQAIARAGGPTLAGSERSITLHRKGVKQKKVDLESLVEDEDVLFIRERLF